MRCYSLLILLFASHFLIAGISESRKFTLDSLVTNFDRYKLRNLDSLSDFIAKSGRGDEEKVFMIYGVFGIHYKYDYDRFQDSKPKEYTYYYTAYRKKGICRDFSALFKELCSRNKIACVEIVGRTKMNIFKTIAKFRRYKLRNPNHVWNAVKIKDSWCFMDPTWTNVKRVVKYYVKQKNGRSRRIVVKIADRAYYKISAKELYKSRNTIHPQNYRLEYVPEFKKSLKKVKRDTLQDFTINNSFFDSLYKNPLCIISDAYRKETIEYSGRTYGNSVVSKQFLFLELKRSKYDRLSKQACIEHLDSLEKLIIELKLNYGVNWTNRYNLHKSQVILKMAKLRI